MFPRPLQSLCMAILSHGPHCRPIEMGRMRTAMFCIGFPIHKFICVLQLYKWTVQLVAEKRPIDHVVWAGLSVRL